MTFSSAGTFKIYQAILNYKRTVNILTNFGLILILFIWSCSSSYSNPQNKREPSIENPVNFGWGRNLDADDGYGYMPVYARFKFVEFPSIRKEGVLKMSFQARYKMEGPIKVIILGAVWAFDVDPIEILWPGPIKKGDIFEASVKVRLREIGGHFLMAYLEHKDKRLYDYSFNFNITEQDQVNHMSVFSFSSEQAPNHLPLSYVKEELVLKYRRHLTERGRQHDGFENTFKIKPIPKLGDTVNVYFSILATRDFPDGIQLQLIASKNIEVLNVPKNWVGYVRKDDVYEGLIRVVFKEPGESRLTLVPEANFHDTSKNKLDFITQAFEIYFDIHRDGKLSWVSRWEKHIRPEKSIEEVAAALGEKHYLPPLESYFFEPRIKVLNWIELERPNKSK